MGACVLKHYELVKKFVQQEGKNHLFINHLKLKQYHKDRLLIFVFIPRLVIVKRLTMQQLVPLQ